MATVWIALLGLLLTLAPATASQSDVQACEQQLSSTRLQAVCGEHVLDFAAISTRTPSSVGTHQAEFVLSLHMEGDHTPTLTISRCDPICAVLAVANASEIAYNTTTPQPTLQLAMVSSARSFLATVHVDCAADRAAAGLLQLADRPDGATFELAAPGLCVAAQCLVVPVSGVSSWPVNRGGIDGRGQAVVALPSPLTLAWSVSIPSGQADQGAVVDTSGFIFVATESGAAVYYPNGTLQTLLTPPAGFTRISNVATFESQVVIFLVSNKTATGAVMWNYLPNIDYWYYDLNIPITNRPAKTGTVTLAPGWQGFTFYGSVDEIVFMVNNPLYGYTVIWSTNVTTPVSALLVSVPHSGDLFAVNENGLVQLTNRGPQQWFSPSTAEPQSAALGASGATAFYSRYDDDEQSGSLVIVNSNTGVPSSVQSGVKGCFGSITLASSCQLFCFQRELDTWLVASINTSSFRTNWRFALRPGFVGNDLIIDSNNTLTALASDGLTADMMQFAGDSGAVVWTTSVKGSGGSLAVTSSSGPHATLLAIVAGAGGSPTTLYAFSSAH
eukprot:m.238841 g.238841  ORF g.238841 m.238841 type:complete len:557 (+) comp13369_c0_seq1:38-1708(+)